MTRMWLVDQYHVLSAGEKRSGYAAWLLFAPVCLVFQPSWKCWPLTSLGTCLGNGVRGGRMSQNTCLGPLGDAAYRDCLGPVRRRVSSGQLRAPEIPAAFWGCQQELWLFGRFRSHCFLRNEVAHQLAAQTVLTSPVVTFDYHCRGHLADLCRGSALCFRPLVAGSVLWGQLSHPHRSP